MADTLELLDSPGGTPLMKVQLDPHFNVTFDLVARSAGFSRVVARVGDVDVDAWVSAAELDEGVRAGVSYRGGNHWGFTGGGSGRVVLARSSPLLVGPMPRPLHDATIEEGAQIFVDRSTEAAFADQIYVAFTFADRMIEAPEGSRLWIAKDAL